MVTKFNIGVCQVCLETCRYKEVAEEKRLCQVCDCGCGEPLADTRKIFLPNFLESIWVKTAEPNDEDDDEEELDDETCIMALGEMIKPENIRNVSLWLEQIYLVGR